MARKIYPGKTSFDELYSVLGFDDIKELEKKRARLFPQGNTDNEIAASSIFLASLSAIKEYREELFTEIGVKKITNQNVAVYTYTELQNPETHDRPDGLIIITSGKNSPIIEWAGFVEAKVRNNPLKDEQIERYAEYALALGIKDIITISNHLVPNPHESPVKISKRSIHLFHWSWMYLKVFAYRLIRTNSVKDPDHIYMLTELRRYFDSQKNMNHYTYMGSKWKETVKKVHSADVSSKVDSITLHNLIESYAQEEKDISLRLTDDTDFHVELFSKGNRYEQLEKMVCNSKTISSQFIINKSKDYTFTIDADFIRQEIRCYTQIEIVKGKAKAQAQTTNLVKIFESSSGHTEDIMIEAFYTRNRSMKKAIPLSQLIDEKRKKLTYSFLDKSLGDTLTSFRVSTNDHLGRDFQSGKIFIVKLEQIATRFLEQVMANLVPKKPIKARN